MGIVYYPIYPTHATPPFQGKLGGVENDGDNFGGENIIKQYIVRMEKENREEVKEEYPNLAKAPVYLTVTKFNVNANLTTATDQQLKQLVKKKVKETKKSDLNPRYDIDRKEKILLVPSDDRQNTIFEKTMIIPRHLRG